jgi:hypothetical protein
MYIIKLKELLLESQAESDVSQEPTVISEKGYRYLKTRVDELNKKAARYGVPPMELKVLKEEFVKTKIFVNLAGRPTTANDPKAEEKEITVKKYTITIEGNSPRVEGYEFIAKIEHTPEGNILNYNPNASVKNLPPEYRTYSQKCDVCETNRERSNTFILKLENLDQDRFPDKNVGDFIMVGSGCLKRFLPGITVSALLNYAEMIESIRNDIKRSETMTDDSGWGKEYSNYENTYDVLKWLATEYLYTGKYLSAKKAQEFQTSSTLQDALGLLYYSPLLTKDIPKEIEKLQTDKTFSDKVDAFVNEFIEWRDKKDFDVEIGKNPNYADFFHNMKIIAKKKDAIEKNNLAKFGALFQIFLRDKGEFERKKELAQKAATATYVGTIGQKLKIPVTVEKIKDFETVYGLSYLYKMKDDNGNVLVWFTSTSPTTALSRIEPDALKSIYEGGKYEIEGKVKKHEPNKYTSIPETSLERVKFLKVLS